MPVTDVDAIKIIWMMMGMAQVLGSPGGGGDSVVCRDYGQGERKHDRDASLVSGATTDVNSENTWVAEEHSTLEGGFN